MWKITSMHMSLEIFRVLLGLLYLCSSYFMNSCRFMLPYLPLPIVSLKFLLLVLVSPFYKHRRASIFRSQCTNLKRELRHREKSLINVCGVLCIISVCSIAKESIMILDSWTSPCKQIPMWRFSYRPFRPQTLCLHTTLRFIKLWLFLFFKVWGVQKFSEIVQFWTKPL